MNLWFLVIIFRTSSGYCLFKSNKTMPFATKTLYFDPKGNKNLANNKINDLMRIWRLFTFVQGNRPNLFSFCYTFCHRSAETNVKNFFPFFGNHSNLCVGKTNSISCFPLSTFLCLSRQSVWGNNKLFLLPSVAAVVPIFHVEAPSIKSVERTVKNWALRHELSLHECFVNNLHLKLFTPVIELIDAPNKLPQKFFRSFFTFLCSSLIN